MIFARASPLAAKFCTKTKRLTFIRPQECAIFINNKKKNSKFVIIL